MVVVDAGAMLFPEPLIIPSLLKAKTVQADGLIKAMSLMGYDAVGIAPQDLAAGADFLLAQPADRQLPWLSANIVRNDGGELLFSPHILKKAGDLTLAIVGITGPQPVNSASASLLDYSLEDQAKALKSTIAKVKEQSDIIILLSSLPERMNRQIAEQYHEINIIIQAGTSTSNIRPQLVGNALITQVGKMGKYLGRIDIDWQPSGEWENTTGGSEKQIKDRLDRINWRIGRMENRSSQNELEGNANYRQLLKEKEQLTARLAELEGKSKTSQDKLSTYKSSFIGLPTSLPMKPDVREIVLDTKKAVNETNRKAMLEIQQQSTAAEQDPFANMAGWLACQSCHQPQTEFWQQTQHAEAWQTLQEINQEFNPDCLICHVTLPTYDPEIVNRENLLAGLAERFKTIGCETCHGPAADHARQPEQFHPQTPDEQTCLRCHTPMRDDDFVYEKKLEKIRCPAAGH